MSDETEGTETAEGAEGAQGSVATVTDDTPDAEAPAEPTPEEVEAAAKAAADAEQAARDEALAAEVASAKQARREQIMTRLVLPLVIPIIALVAGVLFVINLAGLFLGSKDPGNVVLGTTITVLILLGAALLSAAPHMRTSSIALIVAAAFVIVLSGGLTVFGEAWAPEEAAPAGYVPPKGAPVATYQVEALAELAFGLPSGNTVAAGVVEIDYGGASGHTLAFDTKDANLAKFLLEIPPNPDKGKVELVAGETYTIYCTIPGHRAAGMQAEITAK